jgi:hypothetical protein
MNGQIHAPAALPPGRSPRHPLNGWMGGAQSRSGRGDEKNPFSAPAGIGTPVFQPVA